MKLLDMNMPGVWIDFLRAAGFTAMHWRDIGDIRAEDHEIMSWARENGYVVLTHEDGAAPQACDRWAEQERSRCQVNRLNHPQPPLRASARYP